MSRLKDVIAIANNKGGVGKTTTVQNLTAAIMITYPKARVLVIDLDPQCNLSYLMGYKQGQLTVMDALKGNGIEPSQLAVYKNEKGVYYCPASEDLRLAEVVLKSYLNPNRVLCECFRKPVKDFSGDSLTYISDSFDYVLIDCPPLLGDITHNAMAVADGLLIPIQLEALSIQGLSGMLREQQRVVASGLNPGLEIRGILKVKERSRLNTAKGYNSWLSGNDCFAPYILKTFIHFSDDVNQSQILRQNIFDYKPESKVADDYRNLVKELKL